MKLELDAFGDKQVSRRILRFGDSVKDARPAFRSIMRYWRKATQEQFKTEGRRASGGWLPASREWVKFKVLHGYDRRTLHMTRRLRDSLIRVDHPDAIRNIRKQEMDYGTEVPYAEVWQIGGPKRVRRRPLELTGGRNGDRAHSVKILQLFIARGKVIQ